ncbi:MAG: NADPH:quinone reductase-like Zn-dependent oxidoreductase [Oleispira sp.]|jgi:NADPH:quinone reductase-like Zn-dependent oxidoreductase
MNSRQVWRTPKAVAIQRLVQIEELLTELKADEVQVDVKAVGLNFADIFALTGLYSATPEGSFIPGLEYSGIVTKVGRDCKKFKRGDRVMAVSRFGGYASVVQGKEAYLVLLPSDWNFSQGAAYLTQTLTAWYALNDLGNMKAGQDVLIQSAAAWKFLRRPKYDVMAMISENRSVMAFNLIWLWDQVEIMQALLEDMMVVEITPPHVGHQFTFDQAHEAIDCLRSGKTIGKVVLTSQASTGL